MLFSSINCLIMYKLENKYFFKKEIAFLKVRMQLFQLFQLQLLVKFKTCIPLLSVWSIQFQSHPHFVSSPYIWWGQSVATERKWFVRIYESAALHFPYFTSLYAGPVPFGSNHPPPTSSIDLFAPLLPEAVYPKGEWLSIRDSALRCTESRLNALWFPYCASWRRERAGKIESWVTKDRKRIFGNCLSVSNINKLSSKHIQLRKRSVKNNYVSN